MQILNTIPEIRNLFLGKAFDWNIWRRYAAGISPPLASKCEEDIREYDFAREIRPVLEKSAVSGDALDRLNVSFCAAAETLRDRICSLFDAEPDVTILLYWGLCNGAGWATTLDGHPAVLLGAEKIIELGWWGEADVKGLLFHEIGHIWHEQAGKSRCCSRPVREQSVWQLVEEGVAMACEQQLAADEHFYHQNKGDWLSWCTRHETEIKRLYLHCLENGQSTRDFFGDWNRVGSHADVGYFLGGRFVRHLLRNRSLQEIARLPYALLDAELTAFLKT